MSLTLRSLLLCTCFALFGMLLGCGSGNAPSGSAPQILSSITFSGHVHGGQQPVANSRIHLYAAGSSGYGSSFSYNTGTDLLGNQVVVTDADGSFSVTGDYVCPSPSTNIYFVAQGGNPIPGSVGNGNLALIAAFGPCGSAAANASQFISINELSTVAAVYALAPFMTGPANVGTSTSNATGLNNAFAVIGNLVSRSSGTIPAPTLPVEATLPINELNTLADMLASCVNSTGGAAVGTISDQTPCGNLFALTSNANGTAPSDTITAMLNIARNPARNVAALNALVSPISPFQPTVDIRTINAWILAITYAASGPRAGPTSLAADQNGRMWVSNRNTNSVSLLSPSGALISTYAAGQAGSGALAIDQNGNAWTAGASGSSILKITPAGTVTSITGGSLGGVTNAIAIDANGQVWATGSQNGLSLFSNDGVPITVAAPYTGAGIDFAQTLAIGAR